MSGVGGGAGEQAPGRAVERPAGVRAALLLLSLLAGRAGALEPRFDHRDQLGVVFEAGQGWDTVTLGGRSVSRERAPALRLAFSIDPFGGGNELLLGLGWAPLGREAPERIRWALDARYRGYFGSDELKTFFEMGLWAPVSPRPAAGPRVGLGAAWDFSRRVGLYAAFGFATAIGEFRGASLDLASGVQVRWP